MNKIYNQTFATISVASYGFGSTLQEALENGAVHHIKKNPKPKDFVIYLVLWLGEKEPDIRVSQFGSIEVDSDDALIVPLQTQENKPLKYFA